MLFHHAGHDIMLEEGSFNECTAALKMDTVFNTNQVKDQSQMLHRYQGSWRILRSSYSENCLNILLVQSMSIILKKETQNYNSRKLPPYLATKSRCALTKICLHVCQVRCVEVQVYISSTVCTVIGCNGLWKWIFMITKTPAGPKSKAKFWSNRY